jgi:hypothetical protein
MLKYSGMQVANGKKKNLFEGSQDGYWVRLSSDHLPRDTQLYFYFFNVF